jgi:hypothetical protein
MTTKNIISDFIFKLEELNINSFFYNQFINVTLSKSNPKQQNLTLIEAVDIFNSTFIIDFYFSINLKYLNYQSFANIEYIPEFCSYVFRSSSPHSDIYVDLTFNTLNESLNEILYSFFKYNIKPLKKISLTTKISNF